MRWALLAGLTWCCPALAQSPSPEGTAPTSARSRVVLGLAVELSAEERAVLGNLLAPELERRGLTLSLESTPLPLRAWVAERRADARVLLLAVLSGSSSENWRLTVIDPARGRAIARGLPGGANANAAVLEAVASILSSAASALSDGLEVASQPIDDVVVASVAVAPVAVRQRPSQAPAEPAAAVQPLVRGSLAAVVSSFASNAPLQLGFTAALGLRLDRVDLRVSGARYLPAQVSSSLGSFEVGRTASAASVGHSFVVERFELEPEVGCAFELLRRSGASAASDVQASPARSLHRVGPLLDVRLRYYLNQYVALESLVGGAYFPQTVRFLAENPAATTLAEPWSLGFSGQLGIEVRAP